MVNCNREFELFENLVSSLFELIFDSMLHLESKYHKIQYRIIFKSNFDFSHKTKVENICILIFLTLDGFQGDH